VCWEFQCPDAENHMMYLLSLLVERSYVTVVCSFQNDFSKEYFDERNILMEKLSQNTVDRSLETLTYLNNMRSMRGYFYMDINLNLPVPTGFCMLSCEVWDYMSFVSHDLHENYALWDKGSLPEDTTDAINVVDTSAMFYKLFLR
jgi:hypothetical protein